MSEEKSRVQSQQTIPDWSFQDEAVDRSLRELSVGPDRKVGLVIPTGGGKTRTALRIVFQVLSQLADPQRAALWVTHRRNLRTHAHAELQQMLSDGVPDLPAKAAQLLADRIEFIMLSELRTRLEHPTNPPDLVVVDEAHHAAAQSYQPIFETSYSLHGLFLTATPNRTDGLPIGIDRVAYSVTYRDLAKRGVILLPTFEDFPVDNFAWSAGQVEELANRIITRARDDFAKTLVLAPRIDRVEEFYEVLKGRIEQEEDHPLDATDIGFVHGSGNSLRTDTDQFIATFKAKPRAILVTAQLLLEGFDDPSMNTVVITYPSGSLIQLMQAAGRCVRYAPGKRHCYVVQARNPSLAYHFDHRWLYQEISDAFRPHLIDLEYANTEQLQDQIAGLLNAHNVDPTEQQDVLEAVQQIEPGNTCRLLLCGLPYMGLKERFSEDAKWTVVLETEDNSEEFRWIFNDYCARDGDISDPTPLLEQHGNRFGFTRSNAPSSKWRRYTNMLLACYRAKREVHSGEGSQADNANRPFHPYGSTTWLKYVTCHYRPIVDEGLKAFLDDCHNSEATISQYQANPAAYELVIKLRLPLGGCEAYLLDHQATAEFQGLVERLRASLAETTPAEQLTRLPSLLAQERPLGGLPLTATHRVADFLSQSGYTELVYSLQCRSHQSEAQQAPFPSYPGAS